MGITQSQIIKLIGIRQKLLIIVCFIHCQDHRLLRPSQHVRHLEVRIHQSLPHIYKKNDHVCSLNGNLRLLSHPGKDDISRIRLDPTGVDQRKIIIQPGNVRIDPVPCHSRCIFYD